jgi:FkbM family methyltransferase
MRPGWEIACHPESLTVFERLRSLPEQCRELDGFIGHCTPGMSFVDIGAHYGLFTLAALHYGDPEARVYGVEPSQVPFRVLKENVRLSGAESRVELFNMAIGQTDGGYFLIASDRDRPDVTRVPQWTLGRLFSTIGRAPTHLKIDIEGFEAEAIEGSLEALRKHRPLLFLEVHVGMLRARKRDPEHVLAMLRECGYARFELDGVTVTPEEIVRHDIAHIICTP